MRANRVVLALACALVLSASAQAQPDRNAPPESVTVTALKNVPPEVISKFIQTFAAPTAVIGKLARWQTGICPVAVGLRPSAIAFLLERLRDNAARVGAPVDARANCNPNIEIVFTTTPQGLLNNVRKKNPGYLGYTRRSAEADRLAIVIHPIQAWYTTARKDILGRASLDSALTVAAEDETGMAMSFAMGSSYGFRVRDGRSSELYHVIIVIDPNKVLDREMGGVADYISMLALSQVASLDHCQQQLPSIINMMVKGCATPATELTPSDTAFLQGLYKMPRDYALSVQKAGIGNEMRRAFQAQD
jgi:hypothetical protein